MPACREFLRPCRFDGQCLRRNSKHQGIRPMLNLVTAVLAGRFLRWRIPHPCISELLYHSNKPPDRHPRPPKADNRCVAQGAAG
ncbi:hypothetical protein GHI35_11100 [Neisseria meningitidis]|nr:hypothetical protein A6J51_10360 [Neisseria meningitidis]MBG8857277.1 hypothetical protein [Neisseria meningitidis]MBG8865671.1 hypothetical protein [Neisseria meningitidis]MBG8867783.1 hypothetical protein [Neisseria meningitidis]MBG8869893.1 hypothetical protein [Neisseria meningitidis]